MPASAARWRTAAASAARRRSTGDLVIDVPPDSQVHRQVVRKRAEARPIEIDPVVRLALCRGRRAGHARPRQRLPPAAGGAGSCSGASKDVPTDLPVLARLQKTLRAGRMEGHRRRAHTARDIVALWPGLREAGPRARRRHRLDHHRRPSLRPARRGEVVASAGLMNPQIRFGEDLMSRVSYVMMNPGGEAETHGRRARGARRRWSARSPRRPASTARTSSR